jgi:hypothetical protein
MKPGKYIFTYVDNLDRKKYLQRHYCETKEDIDRLRVSIGRAYGYVEEIVSEEQILKEREEYENQEA